MGWTVDVRPEPIYAEKMRVPPPPPESAKADFTSFLRLELLYSILLTRNVVVGGGRFLHCLENFTLVNKPLIAPHHLVMFIINSNLVVHIIK